jgi:hypothetical protein
MFPSSFAVTLLAWLAVPAFLAISAACFAAPFAAAGAGRRPLGAAFAAGAALTAALPLVIFAIGIHGGFAIAVWIVLALASAAAGWRRRPPRQWRLLDRGAIAAAVVAWLLMMAPVLMTGAWTWPGYNFVNDTAVQLLLADHVASHGLALPSAADFANSTAAQHIQIYRTSDYPLGTHAVLGMAGRFIPADLAVLYQPLIATFAAWLALTLYCLARRAGAGAPAAVVSAVGAIAANLFLNYGYQGSLKEVAIVAIVAAAVLVIEALRAEVRLRWGIAAGVLAGTGLTVYATAAAPYLGIAGLAAAAVLVLAVLRTGVRPRAAAVVAIAAVVCALAAAAPVLSGLATFNRVASGNFASAQSAQDLGQLARPLPLLQTAGVWLGGEYRLPVPSGRATLNDIALWAMLLFALAGMVRSLRRREPGPALLLAALAIPVLVLRARLSPYAEAKTMANASPAIVFLALLGATALRWHVSRGVRMAGIAAAAVLLGLVLTSAAYSYRVIQDAPTGRMEALAEVDDALAGTHGLVLLDDFEAFGKWFLRDRWLNVPWEAVTPRQRFTYLQISTINERSDIDQYVLFFIQYYRYIVQRMGADASAAPGNYDLIYANRWYRIWKQVRPIKTIAHHYSFQATYTGGATPPCKLIEDILKGLEPDQRLVAMPRPPETRMDTASARHTAGWPKHPFIPNAVVPSIPGSATARIDFPADGTYQAWLMASTGRTLTVSVDGRRIGGARGVNTQGGWLPAGTVDVSRGKHVVEVRRGHGNLRPGDRYAGWLGQLVFVSTRKIQSVTVPRSRARDLCRRGRFLDWLEVRQPATR